MKALTIKQPWASLIMFHGKDIENREWAAPRFLIGQRIAIHSSKQVDFADMEDARDLMKAENIQSPAWNGQYTQGGVILGTVRLVDCVRESDSPWFFGEYGFVLKDPRPISKPIPIRGALQFWNLPADIARLLA